MVDQFGNFINFTYSCCDGNSVENAKRSFAQIGCLRRLQGILIIPFFVQTSRLMLCIVGDSLVGPVWLVLHL